MSSKTLILFAVMFVAALVLAGCHKKEAAAETRPEQQAVVVGKENVITAANDEIQTGPIVSGSLRAEREANVRAEIGGAVLEVRAEEGQAVRRGQLLARIEDRALRDILASAQSGARSAQNALQVAEREAERVERLVKGGALAERDSELARNAVTAAQAQVADARSRVVSAQDAHSKTTILAPISGTVAKRPVNAGDIVNPGAELFTVIDPAQMEFDASVSSAELGAVRIGAPVEFTVTGSDESFTGRIERINPMADPVTRQVTIVVSVPNTSRKLVAGLFAEGRVSSQRRNALVLPLSAVNRTGNTPTVTRVRDGKAERVEVRLGVEDKRTERVEIISGVQPGDAVLLGTAQQVTPGTPIRISEGAVAQTGAAGK